MKSFLLCILLLGFDVVPAYELNEDPIGETSERMSTTTATMAYTTTNAEAERTTTVGTTTDTSTETSTTVGTTTEVSAETPTTVGTTTSNGTSRPEVTTTTATTEASVTDTTADMGTDAATTEGDSTGSTVEVTTEGAEGTTVITTESTTVTLAPVTYQKGDDYKTWDEAESFCKELGGHLPSIHNVEQNTEVFNHFDEPQWLGGRATINDGNGPNGTNDFSWSDGTHWDYPGWGWNEPNNYGFAGLFNGEEFCAAIGHKNHPGIAEWNDVNCDIEYPFVCAIPSYDIL